MIDLISASQHIKFTVENSPKAYALMRNEMQELQDILAEAELKYQSKQLMKEKKK